MKQVSHMPKGNLGLFPKMYQRRSKYLCRADGHRTCLVFFSMKRKTPEKIGHLSQRKLWFTAVKFDKTKCATPLSLAEWEDTLHLVTLTDRVRFSTAGGNSGPKVVSSTLVVLSISAITMSECEPPLLGRVQNLLRDVLPILLLTMLVEKFQSPQRVSAFVPRTSTSLWSIQTGGTSLYISIALQAVLQVGWDHLICASTYNNPW